MAGLNATPTVEVLYSAAAVVAEAPFYEEESDTLLWVDIYKKTINFFDLKTNKNKCFDGYPETMGAALPVQGCNKLVACMGRKICLIDRDTGSVLEVLATVQEDKPGNRFNDAKCDSSGRLWCGTMGSESTPGVVQQNQGMLYSYSPGCLKEVVVTSLSNGLDWNQDDNVMYYIDSIPTKTLYTFAYNKENGSVTDQKVLIDYGQDAELAMPDGMCTDTAGRLWVASFVGGRLTCWDPQTKEKVMTLKIPGAKRVTSCCFGGPGYSWLFVTSGTYGASKEELAESPNAGALFVIKDLGARGMPAHKFKL